MKYLIIFTTLALTGCGFGYEVDSYTRGGSCLQKTENTTIYTCTHKKPLIFFDVQVAECETLEKCQAICDKLRAN